VGSEIDVESGRWRDETCHIGGRIDSYLEYLWKGWLLFGDEDLRSMWATHVAAFRKHVVMEEAGSLWCGRVDMHSGAVVARSYGALEAFFPGLLALSGDVDRARRLQESSHAMWTLHGLEPEGLDFQRMSVPRGQEAYHLRPEIIESAYHLFRATGDPRYREMGRTYLRDIMRSCRVDAGYAAVRDVRSMRLLDAMPSYFLSETLKYLYLLYSEEAATVIEDAVLTTEGHPLWKTW
jgi:mannosidase alpha-like ER degradation enhancer 2